MPITRIVVVAGQSNAISFGTNQQGFPSGWVEDPSIYYFNGAAFSTYIPGINSSPYGSYWGVEAEFARLARQRQPNVPIVIIKQAYNNTGTAFKANPAVQDWSPFSTGKQWDALFNQINYASAVGLQFGRQLMVEPILWLGNETDAMDEADSQACGANTDMVFRAIRSRLYNCSQSTVIVARCHPNANLQYLNTVRIAQKAIPNTLWVDTDDLSTADGDPGHYSSSAVKTIGARMFALLP